MKKALVGIELSNEIQKLTRGSDGQEVFDTLVGIAIGLYQSAPRECREQMLARVMRTLEEQFGVVMEHVRKTTRQQHRRDQVERELLS